MTIINESGLYSLIFSSKLDTEKKFKHWVTSEVLPQICKTSGYISVNEQENDNVILSKAIVILKKTLDLNDEIISHQMPKVDFADAVTSAKDSIPSAPLQS